MVDGFRVNRTADGRVIKTLTIIDDATHECVTIMPERGGVSGQMLTRILDGLALRRGLPKVIGAENGKEFCGRAMATWAHQRGEDLRLIKPGKPNQDAYFESSNSRFRRSHARVLIAAWHRK